MIPQDGAMLLSYVNTRLRDEYPSLDDLCDDLGVDRAWLEETLCAAGYVYDAEHNAFR